MSGRELSVILTLLIFAVVWASIVGGIDAGERNMCRQWGGRAFVVYEDKCMVREKDGALRPARKDGAR